MNPIIKQKKKFQSPSHQQKILHTSQARTKKNERKTNKILVITRTLGSLHFSSETYVASLSTSSVLGKAYFGSLDKTAVRLLSG